MSSHHPQPPQPSLPPGYQVRGTKPLHERVWFWVLMVLLAVAVVLVTSIPAT